MALLGLMGMMGMPPPAASAASTAQLQELLDALIAGGLPGWVLPLMASTDADGAQTRELARRAVPLLLAPLKGIAADDPKPSLGAVGEVLAMRGAPVAIGELFSAELGLLRTTWSGRQLQQYCWLSPLLSLGVPAVLGRKKGPADPKHNLERLLEAGPRDTNPNPRPRPRPSPRPRPRPRPYPSPNPTPSP